MIAFTPFDCGILAFVTLFAGMCLGIGIGSVVGRFVHA